MSEEANWIQLIVLNCSIMEEDECVRCVLGMGFVLSLLEAEHCSKTRTLSEVSPPPPEHQLYKPGRLV